MVDVHRKASLSTLLKRRVWGSDQLPPQYKQDMDYEVITNSRGFRLEIDFLWDSVNT